MGDWRKFWSYMVLWASIVGAVLLFTIAFYSLSVGAV